MRPLRAQTRRISPRRGASRSGSPAPSRASAARSRVSRAQRTDRGGAPRARPAWSRVPRAQPMGTAAATFAWPVTAPCQTLHLRRDPWAHTCRRPECPGQNASPRARLAAPAGIVAGGHVPPNIATYSLRAGSAVRCASSIPIAAPPFVSSAPQRWDTAHSLRAARPTTGCRAFVRSTRHAMQAPTAARGSAALRAMASSAAFRGTVAPRSAKHARRMPTAARGSAASRATASSAAFPGTAAPRSAKCARRTPTAAPACACLGPTESRAASPSGPAARTARSATTTRTAAPDPTVAHRTAWGRGVAGRRLPRATLRAQRADSQPSAAADTARERAEPSSARGRAPATGLPARRVPIAAARPPSAFASRRTSSASRRFDETSVAKTAAPGARQ
jgi:hypothetical protein